MKRPTFFIPLIILLLAAMACNLPWQGTPEATEVIIETDVVTEEPTEAVTEEPTEEQTETPYTCPANTNQAMAFSVEFCYPSSLFSGFSQTMVAENPPSPDSPIWGVNPDMIEITFTGYAVDNLYHDPQVFIYPVDDLVALDPLYQDTVNNLISLLQAQPQYTDGIPHLPIYNAAQIMRAKISYFDFRNGSGVRYITQYGQGVGPISNDSAIYAFIGLTTDQQYIISATFPVQHPLFAPDIMTEPTEGYEVFAQNFETYLDNMEMDLDAESPDSFTPNLTPLDEMMASFMVPAGTIP